MRFNVKVKPGSKKNSVEKIDDEHMVVRVKEKAIEGRANDAVIAQLSEYFNIPRGRIKVIVGLKSRNKIIDI